jgi:hypothetical protein
MCQPGFVTKHCTAAFDASLPASAECHTSGNILSTLCKTSQSSRLSNIRSCDPTVGFMAARHKHQHACKACSKQRQPAGEAAPYSTDNLATASG